MENFFSRHRNSMILAIVLLLQVFGLAVQVKRPVNPNNPDSGSVRLIRLWAVSIISPLERVFVGTGHWVRQSWHDYVNVGALRHENRALREENEGLRLERAQLAEDAAQAHRLQTLVDFKEKFIGHTVAAQVIGSGGAEQSRVVYIDKGTKDGLHNGLAVITPEGIVGKVRESFPSTAQILVMNDSTSGVGALLEKSRLHGVVKGTPSGELMLDHIMTDEKVEAGERVITSGGDQIYPKGLPVGTVEQVSPGSDLFLNIRLKPAADLSRLEEVLVVTKMEGPQVDLTEAPVRAADVLAQKLPGVPTQAQGQNQQDSGAKNRLETNNPTGKKPEPSKLTAGKSTASTTAGAPKETTPKKSLSGARPVQKPIEKPPQTPEGSRPQ